MLVFRVDELLILLGCLCSNICMFWVAWVGTTNIHLVRILHTHITIEDCWSD